eukprot:3203181-Pyramimonas_sp.AAC.1
MAYFLHVACLYNCQGHLRNERYLDKAFEGCVAVGDQPVLLCADTNLASTSVVIQDTVATGRCIDLGRRFATEDGMEPTYCGQTGWDKVTWGRYVSRPDYIFANPAAAAL